jgi:hypothetical protein
MKKWVSFFLLLITFAASFYPCCSADDCSEETTSIQSPHEEEKEENNNCSPFLACGTCAGFTQLTRSFEIPLTFVLVPAPVVKPCTLFYSNYTPPLLQPPRM